MGWAPLRLDVDGGVAVDAGRRRLESRRLLDRIRAEPRTERGERPLIVVSEQVEERVRGHGLAGLDAAEQHDRRIGRDLLAAVAPGVGGRRRRVVRGRDRGLVTDARSRANAARPFRRARGRPYAVTSATISTYEPRPPAGRSPPGRARAPRHDREGRAISRRRSAAPRGAIRSSRRSTSSPRGREPRAHGVEPERRRERVALPAMAGPSSESMLGPTTWAVEKRGRRP